jgi:hypothetical protein
MAWQDFFVQGGGSNANGGSTNSNTPIYSTASGVWVNSTNIWAVTDAAASALTVGDWCNIGGSYIAQITNISHVGSAYTVTMSSTNVYGSSPSNGTYTVIDGGAWADITTISAFNQQVPVSTRINIQAATYTLSGNLTVSLYANSSNSQSMQPGLWYRGYNTTPGDLDNGSASLAYPTITIGTNEVTVGTGGNTGTAIWSGLSFTGNANGDYITFQSNVVTCIHCRFQNTNTGSSSSACRLNAGLANNFYCCYFAVTSTGGWCLNCSGNPINVFGCYFTSSGGSSAIGMVAVGGNSPFSVHLCTFVNMGQYGIDVNSSVNNIFNISNNTFFGCGSHALHFQGLNNNIQGSTVSNNAFGNSGGYDIYNGGSAYNKIIIFGNLHYNATSGPLFGFGDLGEWNPLTDVSNPFLNSSASPPDLHLVGTSSGAAAGIPGLWES